MFKKRKDLDKCSRGEQLFTLLIFCIVCFGVLCLSGCGGSSCETVQCGKESGNDYVSQGISIPGIGGCWNSGKGCDSCLWPQSCKLLTVNSVEEAEEDITFISCDTEYYTGCGKEKSCYTGFISSDANDTVGIFYGNTAQESVIGCADGCGGCVSTGGYIREILDANEDILGIN